MAEATLHTRPQRGTVARREALEPPRVGGVAVSTPAASFTQAELLALLGLADDDFATSVFARSGVTRRRLGISEHSLATTLQERTAETEDRLLGLAVEAIDRLAPDPEAIGAVVTGSYYSLGGPTLAHRIVDRYGLDPSTDKYHVVGVGCASAVPLFRLATACLHGRPERQALVVAAEAVSGFMTPAKPGDERVKTVGSALFGDGCAAALLDDAEGASGPAILATAVHQVPETLGHVRFRVTGDDSHLEMSRELPAVAERSARDLVEGFLDQHGLTMADVDHWLVHPGGRGILEALQRALGLSDSQVAPSAGVLSEFGNVGTPSALFVLARTLAERLPAPGDRGLMITIGPGVTVGLMLLGWDEETTEEVAQ